MTKDNFQGDKKAPMRSPLARMERRFIDSHVEKIPAWIGRIT